MNNRPWKLQSFVDALVYELDKARNTLSVKGINNPMSYAVKDMDVELQVFPEYDGDDVRFTLAGSGQSASSKIAFKLGSITDRQIRETSKEPASNDDVIIDDLDIDNDLKKELKKVGVDTVRDMDRIKENNVSIKSSVDNSTINFNDLANKIRVAKERRKRAASPPAIKKASLSKSLADNLIQLEGNNLHIFSDYEPKAFINKKEVEILSINESLVELKASGEEPITETAHLTLFLDPFTIVKFKLK
jgi:hypothetical protein